MKDAASRLEQLRAEARYRRSRLALYRARIYSLRATSDTKLRDLERSAQAGVDRKIAAPIAASSFVFITMFLRRCPSPASV